MQISEIVQKYTKKLDYMDLELIIAHSLGKPREFVLAHPEYILTSNQQSVINKLAKRRIKGEPIAYIVGYKEFYGLDFIVDKNTLIPRPETELLVESVIKETRNTKYQIPNIILDVGTGSGNIIVSAAHNMQNAANSKNTRYYATDISKDALKIAKKNAQIHRLDKKIKFLHGNLFDPLIRNMKRNIKDTKIIAAANLPYLSHEIYSSAPVDVKKYEPKSALYSPKQGLQYYEKLLKQIKKILVIGHLSSVICFFEISPEQKSLITKTTKNIFPNAKISFEKDLAGKWRVCRIKL